MWGLGNITVAQIGALRFKLAVDPSPQKIATVDYTQMTIYYMPETNIQSGTIVSGTLR